MFPSGQNIFQGELRPPNYGPAVALLSTVGNVVLEKNVLGAWRTGLNWIAWPHASRGP